MRLRAASSLAVLAIGLGSLGTRAESAGSPNEAVAITQDAEGIHFKSGRIEATFSLVHPALLSLGIDSLGGGKVEHDVLSTDDYTGRTYGVTRRPTNAGATLDYTTAGLPAGSAPAWSFAVSGSEIRVTSRYVAGQRAEPFTLSFDTHRCYATLLGLFNDDGTIRLPAVLHLPGFGSLRLSGSGDGNSLGYASGPGWVKVSFPAADAVHPAAEYRWSVVTLCPDIAGTKDDARYDGFRRNWLNIFQLNPNRRVLSNNTNSDTCGFCYYEYADIAKDTPPLADNLHALDMIRQSLERVLGGMKTYGMPGYGDFPEETSDTYPSLLIAAVDYVEGRNDKAWLRERYPALKGMAERMLATDRDGNGLISYIATGNSGSWNEGPPKVRPSNWWDTIGFGHNDAYANALAYRALLGMARMADAHGHPGDSRRFSDAATKLHDAYFAAFYGPSTGVLAGWRSADGKTHDYYFLFVNGIAVLYGLVPAEKEAPIMDRLWEKMHEVGFTDFSLGLPGNLVPVARKDYAHKDPRYGGGKLEDNSDGFEIYENGGATACFSYFTIAAFDHIGQHDKANEILLPILEAFEKREFEGAGPNHLTNDWRKWDGTSEGYEGFLTDNYYALLAGVRR
jgi:Bacterial alpha-L-rhamnosidase 6 hairpin glycosidase domain